MIRSPNLSLKAVHESFRLIFHGKDIGPDLFQGAQERGLVKVAGKGDLVADPGALLPDPGVRRVGQHLPANKNET